MKRKIDSRRFRQLLIYFVLAALVCSVSLLASARTFRVGYPLDDAWIHQTYARNLAQEGSWSFQQGTPSAGSTSPLWSGLLSMGYLLRLHPIFWSTFLGVLTLASLAAVAARGLRSLAPEKPEFAFWAGVLVIFEWHLVWSAVSGMETLLFALFAAVLLVDLVAGRPKPFLHGLLIGAAVWVRPSGLTLLGPVVLVLLLGEGPLREKAGSLFRLIGGFLLLFGPYLIFNYSISGDFWPSTLFAKQAEYAVLRELPFLQRLARQLGVPAVGVGALLAPGMAWLAWISVRDRRWGLLAALVWAGGMAFLYAWRLPVTYQHGRYLIPVIPVWLIWGLGGLVLLARPFSKALWPRVLSRAWMAAAAAVAALFFILGVQAFARDVAVIESEMVDTARWASENLPSGALVAAHDIGALGYFSERQLLDLAGLVTPEVIPFLRDQAALRAYLDSQHADYLVTLEGWYPDLEAGLEIIFRTDAPYSPALGGSNMIIYRWSGDSERAPLLLQ